MNLGFTLFFFPIIFIWVNEDVMLKEWYLGIVLVICYVTHWLMLERDLNVSCLYFFPPFFAELEEITLTCWGTCVGLLCKHK